MNDKLTWRMVFDKLWDAGHALLVMLGLLYLGTMIDPPSKVSVEDIVHRCVQAGGEYQDCYEQFHK